jgi:DNA-binding MarR family transcriptional regulator
MAALNEKGLINRYANLNDGERAKIVSPTTDAQQSMAQNVTNTNNAEVLIKVDAPAGTEVKSDNKAVSVVPQVGSTMPKR